MSFVARLKQTVALSNVGSHFFRQYPSLLFYPLFSFFLCFLLEVLVLTFIYLRYGIHFFNHETLEFWGLMSIWELGFVFVVAVGPLYCLVLFFTFFAKACLGHALYTLYEQNGRYSFFESFIQAVRHSKDLLQCALLHSALLIIRESGIKAVIKHYIESLGGKDYVYQTKANNWLESSFLIIPLVMIKNVTVKEAVSASRGMMQEIFGKNAHAQFSFLMLIVTLIALIVYPLSHLIMHSTNGMFAMALFFLLCAGIMCSVHSLEGIFHLVVYRYCMQQPIDPFTRDEIQRCFIACQSDEE